MTVNVFYDAGAIHLASHDPRGFHFSVTNKPTSTRYHPTGYEILRRLLVNNNRWPDGAE